VCVLQCIAVRCSVLQCVAVCCSVLQCAAVCCSVLAKIALALLIFYDDRDGILQTEILKSHLVIKFTTDIDYTVGFGKKKFADGKRGSFSWKKSAEDKSAEEGAAECDDTTEGQKCDKVGIS